MRELVILGSSSIVNPPNHHLPDGHRRHHHSPKPKPKQSVAPSRPIPTVHSRSPPLLSTVRYDITSPPDKSMLKYYSDLAAKLAADGRLREFSMIIESVAASGVDASDFVSLLALKPVGEGILQNLRDGNVRSVLEVFREVERLGVSPAKLVDEVSVELFQRECGRILKCQELPEIVEFMEILAGLGFSIKDIVQPMEIVKMCVDQRDPDMAVRYASIPPYDRMLFCTIISEFGKRKDLDSALTAYEAFMQILSSPNMYMCRAIVDVCGLCGEPMKSRLIYEGLLEKKITPNIYVFNSLMNVNAHDLTYIMHIYQNMQNLGVTADTTSHNIILKACCLAGRVDLAQDMYNTVKQLELAGTLKLDVFTYCTIIKVFADAKLWQMALKVKEDMLASGVTPNTYTWSSLISACGNAGLVEHAIQLFEEMLLSGCKPNSQCCNILLHACVEARQYDRAFRLFQSWKKNGLQEALGDRCSSQTEDDVSEPISPKRDPLPTSNHWNFITKFPFAPTTTTYNILMEACGTDYQRAKSLMNEMKEEGLPPNQISWSILIHMCGASGDAELAVQTLKDMRMAGVQPDGIAYTTAIKVCVESRNLQLAFSLFAEMKRYLIKPDLVTYNTLLRARTRYGSLREVQQCLAIYQEMRKAGYNANDYYLKQLIEEWCEGVIQHNGPRQDRSSGQTGTATGRPHNLLLEKVAAHLQNGISGRVAINLQGLTKVESRIVVLAVLRMIKENYTLGHPVNDDISIILGVDEVGAAESAKNGSELRDTILKLVQNDLGLQVLASLPGSPVNMKISQKKHPDSSSPILEEERVGRTNKMVSSSSTRRPVMLQRLKITKESLHHWVQKRAGTFST
ncbi:unnamed protein product [Linum tenue]|uniref:PROP1-like PPR domain-containing protein n=1 Tax=Linum tenue TaxID=586396 RepID=A0AAV0PPH9_9ROSI|nr:unnamed protein product [Linum tenue]